MHFSLAIVDASVRLENFSIESCVSEYPWFLKALAFNAISAGQAFDNRGRRANFSPVKNFPELPH